MRFTALLLLCVGFGSTTLAQSLEPTDLHPMVKAARDRAKAMPAAEVIFFTKSINDDKPLPKPLDPKIIKVDVSKRFLPAKEPLENKLRIKQNRIELKRQQAYQSIDGSSYRVSTTHTSAYKGYRDLFTRTDSEVDGTVQRGEPTRALQEEWSFHSSATTAPLMIAFNPFSRDNQMPAIDTLQPTGKVIEVNGRPCHQFIATVTRMNYFSWSFAVHAYFDPSNDWSLSRLEYITNGELKSRIDVIETLKTESGHVLPKSWNVEADLYGTHFSKSHVTVETYKFNEANFTEDYDHPYQTGDFIIDIDVASSMNSTHKVYAHSFLGMVPVYYVDAQNSWLGYIVNLAIVFPVTSLILFVLSLILLRVAYRVSRSVIRFAWHKLLKRSKPSTM